MEALFACCKPVSKTHGYCLDHRSLSENTLVEDQLENELGYVRIECLCIEDNNKKSELDNGNAIAKGDGLIYPMNGEIKSDHRSLGESATFPSSDNMFSSGNALTMDEKIQLEDNWNKLGMNAASSRPTSLPSLQSPIKLVSAMKGGREKVGIPPQRLSVSWTPDVYDPTPTIVSHTVRHKKQQKNSKKKGKNKEKGKKGSHAGGSSKDKKLFRRMSGGSDKCYKSTDIAARSTYPDNSSDPFIIGSPDSYCGDSFLRESLVKVHMSATEAL